MKNRQLAILLLGMGCAAAPEGPAPPPVEQPDEMLMPDVRVQGGGNLRYTLDERGTTHVLEATPESAWPHLLAAYEALEIAPDVVDESSFRVAVSDLTVVRRLAGDRLSRIVSCGMTMTGALADDARVTFQLRSQLYEAPGGQSTLQTRVEALAVPNDAAGGGARPCTSRHRLELRIAENVAEGLGMDTSP
jgi:hypothetical protein